MFALPTNSRTGETRGFSAAIRRMRQKESILQEVPEPVNFKFPLKLCKLVSLSVSSISLQKSLVTWILLSLIL